MKFAHYLVWVALAIAVAGCGGNSGSAPEKSDPKLSQIELEGLKIPGTTADAKALGFTECQEQLSQYTCVRTTPTTLAGVTAKKAYVELGTTDAFKETYWASTSDKVVDFDPAKLSYRSVQFEFDRVKVDQKCIAKKQRPGDLIHPEECEIAGGLDTLESALVKAGWIKKPVRRSDEFYYEGKLARVVINPLQQSVKIEPIGEREARDFWSELRAAENAKNAAAKKRDEFIQSMKQ